MAGRCSPTRIRFKPNWIRHLQSSRVRRCRRLDAAEPIPAVHSREFYVHFDHSESIPDTEEFCHHLNGILPADIAIHDLIPVKEDAHARFDATARTYEYHLYDTKNPFLRDFASFFRRNWITKG